MAGTGDAAGQAKTGELAIARSVAELRRAHDAWLRRGERIALVPTMGALHRGHLALVQAAQADGARVVVSIFVNPRQFGPGEDLATYPRPEADDVAKLRQARADLLFAPSVAEMYPDGFSTVVSVAGVSEGLCGAHRLGHFDGVATVVAKLLLQAAPHVAYFGEKDYQQLQVVRRLVRDLDMPARIEAVPTVREADGLAISSRNIYLSAAERQIAPALYRVLSEVAGRLAAGRSPAAELARGRAALASAGFSEVEYLELRDAETLAPLTARTRPGRLLAAVRLGRTRLIDNVPMPPAARQTAEKPLDATRG